MLTNTTMFSPMPVAMSQDYGQLAYPGQPLATYRNADGFSHGFPSFVAGQTWTQGYGSLDSVLEAALTAANQGGGSTASAIGPSRVVNGSGGYIYRQYQGGAITIVGGPTGTGTTLTSGTSWSAIRNEIGPYPSGPTGARVTGGKKGNGVGGFFNRLFTQIGDGDKQAGQMKVITTGAQAAPDIITSISDFFQGRASDQVSLQRKIAITKGDIAKAQKKGQSSKVQRLRARLAEFEARLAALRAQGVGQGVPSTVAAPPPMGAGIVVPLVIGGGLLAVIVYFATANRRGQN